MGAKFEVAMGSYDLGEMPFWRVYGLALVGLFASGCIWLLLGWDRADARGCIRAWMKTVMCMMDRLAHLLFRCFEKVKRLFGLSRSDEPRAGLGDVSEMIDIVRLGLKAGLSFDASLELYCEGRSGVLSETMVRARLSWQTGLMSRELSLLDAARELGVKPLESFAVAVSQALELGAPLSDTLETQGKEIRAAHRAEIERQIERVPVKLLIPTGTLILPALLVSIVGPLVAAGGMM